MGKYKYQHIIFENNTYSEHGNTRYQGDKILAFTIRSDELVTNHIKTFTMFRHIHAIPEQYEPRRENALPKKGQKQVMKITQN